MAPSTLLKYIKIHIYTYIICFLYPERETSYKVSLGTFESIRSMSGYQSQSPTDLLKKGK